MFGTARKPKPAPELRCSFCQRSSEDVRKLIAGPTVYICDDCVDICVRILAEDRAAEAKQPSEMGVLELGAGRKWPPSDAWCALCGEVADMESALNFENRALLCERCVASIAQVASQAGT